MNSFLFLKENISIIPIMYYNKLLHMYFYNFFLKNTLQHLNLDTTNYFYNMWVLFLSYFFKYKTNFKTVKSFVCINKFIYNMYFNTNYFFYFYYNRSNMLYKKHIFDLLEFTNNYKDRISYFHNNHFFYLSYLKFYLYGININLFISILFLLIFWFYFSDFFKDMLEIEFSLYGNYKKEVFKYHKYKYRL